MSGITFIDPQWLWLLVGLPLYAWLRWWEASRRRRAQARFSDLGLFKLLNPTLAFGGRLGGLRLLLTVTALALIILAVARPGGNPTWVEQEKSQKGLDIMLLLDLSASMKATDISPTRMQAAKTALKSFIDRMETDRIGLVIFAGSVSMQSPLTLDYRTAKMMIDIVGTDFLPVDGTAIGDALQYALEKIEPEARKSAVLILLTDGENTKGKPPVEVVTKIREAGTRVYTIGLGTPEGAKIPDGVDEKGNPKFKTYLGEAVVTKLDPQLLERIAQETGGKYFSADTSEALQQAYTEISRLTKTEHTEKKKTAVYQEYYAWPASTGLMLLLLEVLLAMRTAWRRPKAEKHAAA
jgi:Ca-activated chloride channel homolog